MALRLKEDSIQKYLEGEYSAEDTIIDLENDYYEEYCWNESMEKNKDKIQLVLRYAPLHKDSDKVVVMLEATKKQDMFLESLEASFKTQRNWAGHNGHNLNNLWGTLSDLGLDMDKLLEDMKDPELMKIVIQDIEDGRKLGATKTPSYYVNGKPLQQFGLQNLKISRGKHLNTSAHLSILAGMITIFLLIKKDSGEVPYFLMNSAIVLG